MQTTMPLATPKTRATITTPASVLPFVWDMTELEQEQMRVVHLDNRGRMLGEPRVLYQGTINSIHVRMAELFREAIRVNASSIVLVHNHPSGDPTPSRQDIDVTHSAVAAGRLLDVELLDHVIVGREGHVSLKTRNLGFE
jgi:DNA repair protein RadC